MHHNPCFNLFILHSNPFDNQGSEINENDIFLRFNILPFTRTLYIKNIYIKTNIYNIIYIITLYKIYIYIYIYNG